MSKFVKKKKLNHVEDIKKMRKNLVGQLYAGVLYTLM